MAKDPAFLFYPNDWIGGTMGMTFEEKGAYMELLMMQFNRGHMTTHMIGQTVGQLWDKIQDKFVQDDEGKWYNERLEEEKSKRKNFVKSRNNNLSGVNQHTKKKEKKEGHVGGHMSTHMENENVNVNNRVVKDLKTREENFYKEIAEFSKLYPKDMLRAFYNYWVEPNKSKTKMRYEMQKTWDLNLRLQRWASKNTEFSDKTKSNDIPPEMRHIPNMK